MTMRPQQKKITKDLKQRVGRFSKITGSPHKPYADTEICTRVFKSMIVPVSMYACSVTCIMPDKFFEKIDKQLRIAARLAIHAPPSTSNDYVYKLLGLESSKTRTTTIARNYILNPQRSPTVQTLIQNHKKHRIGQKISTPLDVILSDRANTTMVPQQ